MKTTLIITFLLLISCAIAADDIRFSMDEEPYYKGSPFRYQLILENKTPDAPPELPATTDLSVQALQPQSSTSSQVYIFNGKRTENKTVTTTYTFLLTPRKTGTVTIPEGKITINGRVMTIPSRKITVRSLDTNRTITLTATADKNICAVGEPVTISFRWTSTANIQEYQFNIPLLSQEGFDVEPAPLSKQLQNLRGVTSITVNGDTRIPAFQRASNAQISIQFAINVIPRKPGIHQIQPSTVLCEVIDTSSPRRRQNRNSFFDDPFMNSPFFGQQYNTVKCAAETSPIKLEVKEPPSSNRPYSYTGLAEPCSISVTADKTDVYVGDPIVLSITLQGPRFPQSIILPKLNEAPAFKENFRIFDNDAPGQLNPNSSITFKRTIRATSTEVKQIPSLEISWFDAKDGQYHTSSSQPIPLEVKATKQATAITSGQVIVQEKVDVSANSTGPRGNFPSEECLVNQHKQNTSATSTPTPYLLFGMPFLTLLLLLTKTIVRHRAANADAYRVKGAARNALHALGRCKNAEGHQASIDAINSFIGDKLKRNPDSITLQDIESFLKSKNTPEELIERTRKLVNDCEAAIYARQSKISPDEARNLARQLIIDLDKATR